MRRIGWSGAGFHGWRTRIVPVGAGDLELGPERAAEAGVDLREHAAGEHELAGERLVDPARPEHLRAEHLHRLGAEQEAREAEGVAAHVPEAPAAPLRPEADVVRAVEREAERPPDEAHRPDRAAVHQLLDLQGLRVVAVHERLGEDDAALAGRGLHGVHFRHGERERLLAQDVLPRAGGPDRPLRVEVVRQRDVDGVDPGIGRAAPRRSRARARSPTPSRRRPPSRPRGWPRRASRLPAGSAQRRDHHPVDAGRAEQAPAKDAVGHGGGLWHAADRRGVRLDPLSRERYLQCRRRRAGPPILPPPGWLRAVGVCSGGTPDPGVSAVLGVSSMRQREAVRIVPRSPITVAIQDGGVPFAYGVVANISEGGACIWTDVSLEPGHDVSLRLSFPRGSQPLDAEGVVVWCEPRGGRELPPLRPPVAGPLGRPAGAPEGGHRRIRLAQARSRRRSGCRPGPRWPGAGSRGW